MPQRPLVVSLPIADRAASARFYAAVLGAEPFGEPASDGLPEPLQFAVNDGVTLVLVPTGGFGWVVGPHEVAPRGHSECLLSVTVEDEAAVAAVVGRAEGAGGAVVGAPEQRPWGYTATFADPDGHLWMVEAGA